MIKCFLMIPSYRDMHLSKSPPLGIAYIAANLEKHGVRVKIIDAPTLGLNHQQVLGMVRRFKPDWVGISVTVTSFRSACQHVDQIKEFLPKCKFVFGGPIVTFEAEKILGVAENVDFCVRGEGEETMLELVKTPRKSPRVIPGLTFRDGKRIVRNPDRPLIDDLDKLPFPAWHLLPMSRYQGPTDLDGGKPFSTLIATRGCLFKCRFCAATIMWRGQRRRKIENVLREMETLSEKYKVRCLHFPDDLLLAKRDYALKFCQGLIERGLNKIHWSCNGRVNLMDMELLKNLKKAGCVCVYYGIESGNQKILDDINKGVTLAQIRRAIKLTHQAGLRASGSFLIGYPGETEKTIRQTVDLAISLDMDYASFHIVVPYPGTPLYDECVKKGWLLSERWEEYVLDVYGEPNRSVIKLEHLRPEEVSRLYTWANNRFTRRPAFFLKMLKNHPILSLRLLSANLLK